MAQSNDVRSRPGEASVQEMLALAAKLESHSTGLGQSRSNRLALKEEAAQALEAAERERWRLQNLHRDARRGADMGA